MRVSTAGHVRNPARTSVAVEGAATVQTIASEAYFAPPLIAEARAIDALNNDTALGPGDQLHVAFDRETNGYAGLPAIGSGGHNLINRTYVDALIEFRDAAGEPLNLPRNAQYSATFMDSSTLIISFGEGLGNASDPRQQPKAIAVKPDADLRTRAGVSRASSDAAPILGSFGDHEPPHVAAFVARDIMSAGFDYNRGDQLVVFFDRPTDMAAAVSVPYAGGRELVDEIFTFSHGLGSDYEGRWLDASTFGVVVLDPTGAGPPVIGRSSVSVRTNRLCNAASSRESCGEPLWGPWPAM